MTEKWTRNGQHIADSVGQRGIYLPLVAEGTDTYRAAVVDELVADANYGAAIRPFAEAAEKAVKRHVRGGIGRPGAFVDKTDEGKEHQALLITLEALPLPHPPNPTLAEQGEELKEFIDLMQHAADLGTCGGLRECDRLKGMVDDLLAGKERDDGR